MGGKMANVKYGMAGKFMTTKELREMEERIRQRVMKDSMREMQARYKDFLAASADDALYIDALCFCTALIEEGYGYERLMRVLTRVADIMDAVNDENTTLEAMEERLAAKGIRLQKEG